MSVAHYSDCSARTWHPSDGLQLRR